MAWARAVVLSVALALVSLSAIFCPIVLLSIYQRTQFAAPTSETAKILSKHEHQNKSGPYTEVSVAYTRSTKDGPQNCTTSVKLRGWSTRYDPGKSIEIWPRVDSCHAVWPTPPENIAVLWNYVAGLTVTFLLGFGLLYKNRGFLWRLKARGG